MFLREFNYLGHQSLDELSKLHRFYLEPLDAQAEMTTWGTRFNIDK